MSEKYLCRDLEQSRRGRAHDMAKGCAADVAIHGSRAVKLSVIEHVKSLQAHIEGFRFPELESFLQRQVIIFDTRPGEESAAAVTWRAERRQTEQRGIE